MLTIVEIVEQIKIKKDESKLAPEDEHVMEWKPKECTEYILPPFNLPDVRSKKSTRERLSKVLAFIDLMKHKRLAHGCTIMPIACTNKKLIKICGSQRNASNLIIFMCKMGLLETESEQYQFNARIEQYNQSKTYRYYYENERKIIDYCMKNGIEKYVMRNNMYIHTVAEKFDGHNFDIDQVKFNSILHLTKPDGLSVAQFEEYLTGALYSNYPELTYYQSMADYINETYYADDPDRRIHFTPTFTWMKNKYVRKIGIRATNAFVSAKGEKDSNGSFNGYYREDILKRYELTLKKDVRSSVPRITLSMNTGRWIAEDIDIYRMIYDEYIRRKSEKRGCGVCSRDAAV